MSVRSSSLYPKGPAALFLCMMMLCVAMVGMVASCAVNRPDSVSEVRYGYAAFEIGYQEALTRATEIKPTLTQSQIDSIDGVVATVSETRPLFLVAVRAGDDGAAAVRMQLMQAALDKMKLVLMEAATNEP